MESLVHRLRTRALIRRQISTRKSVQEGRPDRLADLLDEAALAIEHRNELLEDLQAYTACVMHDRTGYLDKRLAREHFDAIESIIGENNQ